jgi:hypothetical protein
MSAFPLEGDMGFGPIADAPLDVGRATFAVTVKRD